MHGHYGRSAEQTAKAYLIAHFFADCGNNAYRRRLVVDHTDRRFVRDHRRNRRCGRVAGDCDHIQPHAANAGHRFELIEGDFACLRRADHADVFGNGYERTRKPANARGSPEYTDTNENQFPTQMFVDNVSPYTDKVYVTTLCNDYENDDFTSMNGNITVTATKTGVTVACSASDTLLKDTEWFKKNRTCPSAWK